MMTWESDFKVALLMPIAFSFLSPRSIVVYSAILFMHWNCNLAAYEVLTLDGENGETMIDAALGPKDPHEPSQKVV